MEIKNLYLCSVKFFSIILSFCFIALAIAPCTKQFLYSEKADSCCSPLPNDQTNDSGNQHPEKNCTNCNPLASCHCCSVFFSLIPAFDATCPEEFPKQHISYFEFVPSPAVFTIWQPPKIF